jgi:2-dehydropantoate 2-reductase
MRMVVIGAGGTGGYFGGLLARAGEEVSFLARGTQLEALRTRGLTVKSHLAGTFSLPVHATSDPQEIGPVDLVLFCVKTYDTQAASEGLHLFMGPQTVVLPIQNGIDAAEQLSGEVGMQHLVGGVAYVTSHIEALNGTMVRLGQEHGMSLPFNYAIYAALKPYTNGAFR